MFDNVHDWTDCQNELKCYFEKYCVQTKVCEREKQRIADKNEQSVEHVENDEDDDSGAEIDYDGRFSFMVTVPDEVPMRKKNVT